MSVTGGFLDVKIQVSRFKANFETFLLIYILLQPFIDLFTSLSIFALKVDLTIGVFARFFVMILAVFYLLIVDNGKMKKQALIYLFILGGFFAASLVNNLLVKDPMSIFAEVKNIAKLVYMTILMFSYIYALRALSQKVDWTEKVQRYVYYSMIVIGIVMLLASITNTGIKSYESVKLGHQGWFFAGNELGAIMAICFSMVMLYAIKRTTSWKHAYYWIPVGMMIFSMLALGTKVGYGSVLIILVISLVMNVFEYVRHRKNTPQKNIVNIILNSVILAVFLAITPYTPVMYNTNIHLQWVGVEKEKVEKKEVKREDISDEGVQNIILSGREQFLALHKEYYAEAPLSQKLLGMGYGGNYEKEAKTVEMDFYDLFFSFGIIGFLLFLLPYIVLAGRILWAILANIGKYFNTENVLVGSGIILGLGIAYTAGHVLFAPAVSIYLALLISYLAMKVNVIKISEHS
jgi:O-antigen ligase like membrane protein